MTYLNLIDFYLPETVVSNSELKEKNPEWDMVKTEDKTGIINRHISKANENSTTNAIKAIEKLVSSTNLDLNSIDAVIFNTQTPEYLLTASSLLIQSHFSLKDDVFCIDLNHACAGYIYALSVADSLIKSGHSKKVLIVTSDTYSKKMSPKDRATISIFGDGASASVISSEKKGYELKNISVASNGKEFKRFYIPQNSDYIEMDGMGILTFVASIVSKHVKNFLIQSELRISDLRHIIFHQASLTAIQTLQRSLKASDEQVFINIKDIGNTVSSSIPIAIKSSQQFHNHGDKLLFCGFGAGLSWGSIIAIKV